MTEQRSPIYARFEHAATRHPDKIALVAGTRRLRYGELLTAVDALAAGLAASGMAVGDHVGTVLPNDVEFVQLLLAAARLGLVIVPQSTGASGDALASTLSAAGVRHLVAWAGVAFHLDALELPSAPVRIVVGAERTGWLPWPDVVRAGARQSGQGGAQCWSDISGDQPFLMGLTSGSTGQPKPIVLSQQIKLLRAEAAARLYGVTEDDVTLAATPLYHSLAQRLVLLPLTMGGTSVVMAHFTPSTWITTVRDEAVTFSIAVSSQLRQILDALAEAEAAPTSLRCLVSSSALLDDDTKRRLLESLSCAFHECYGASEIAIATNLAPDAAATKLGSVGTAIPGTEIRIFDPAGTTLPPGTPGEIACRTTMLFSGYHGRPDVTKASMFGDFFRTGDLGRLDEDGYLYFLGRIKDIIISGGVNVYPKDIEDTVASHPAVKECAAIPLEDERLGEVAGVVVAFHDTISPPDVRELQRLCMAHLGDHQQPHRFFVVPALPRNALGKLDKPALRQAFSAATQKGHAWR